ncbi:MAG: SAM-dependent methyltransferase [Bacteroidales bacterium]|nr:SAM-dependent methyltransferase [Bacteroidales bacterium]
MNCELCINDKDFIKKHLKDDVNKLALSKFPEGIDKQFVIRQIQARQVLSKKLPSWAENDELIFPKKLSLEQCSSELTAKYKASLSTEFVEERLSTKRHETISVDSCELVDKERVLVDLTGGMGVDTAFLSDDFDKTFYVEMQEELCEIAKHNFKVLNKNIEVVNDNAEHFLTICDEVDCIYLDPARRDEYGRKMVSLHDCSPDVVELHDLLLEKAKRVLIKVSPMLDIEMVKKELKDISSIHVVAVRNECKEVLISQRTTDNGQQSVGASQHLSITATDLREGWNFTFFEEEELNAQWTLADGVGKYLYEPGVACMKAGCFKLLSQRYALDKLHRNSHLYTSDELISDFPGRIFEVLEVFPFDKKTKKEITSLLNQQPTAKSQQPKVSVATRNFPLSAEELKKNLGVQDGSDFYLFGTTMKGEKKVVIIVKKN